MGLEDIFKKGEKIGTWEKGDVFYLNDKYYYIDNERERVVMKGNFI